MVLLLLDDLLHHDIEVAMAFDGVLPPESLSFAGRAAISRSLAFQITQEPVREPTFLSWTAGLAGGGKPELSARSVVATRSGPTVPIRPRRARGFCIFWRAYWGQDTSRNL